MQMDVQAAAFEPGGVLPHRVERVGARPGAAVLEDPRLVAQFRSAPMMVERLAGGQEMGRRAPAGVGADHPRSDFPPGKLFRVFRNRAARFAVQPGGVGELAFDELVSGHTLDVVPILRMAVVGQGRGQAQKIHQGACFAEDDVALPPDLLGQKAEARRFGADIAIKRVDAAEKLRVAVAQSVIRGADERSQIAVHVAAVAEMIIRSEGGRLVEDEAGDRPGQVEGGLVFEHAGRGHDALDEEAVQERRFAALRGRVAADGGDELAGGVLDRRIPVVQVDGDQRIQRQGLIARVGHGSAVRRFGTPQQSGPRVQGAEKLADPFFFPGRFLAGHVAGHDRALELAGQDVPEIGPIVGRFHGMRPENFVDHAVEVIERAASIGFHGQGLNGHRSSSLSGRDRSPACPAAAGGQERQVRSGDEPRLQESAAVDVFHGDLRLNFGAKVRSPALTRFS